jgi:hypothetical protein
MGEKRIFKHQRWLPLLLKAIVSEKGFKLILEDVGYLLNSAIRRRDSDLDVTI